MPSRRVDAVVQWIAALGALAGIVFVYRRWVHVNPTTVALTLLLYILLLAARWRLQYAVVVSFVATALYNYYFLPPVGTFTISDPQNWLALFAFLTTGVIGSRLSQRARRETAQARARQHEVEILFSLSRELLQTDKVADLVNSLPGLIRRIMRTSSAVLYLLEGDRLYCESIRPSLGVEIPHFRQLALGMSSPETTPDGETRIPIKAGVRPRGILLLDHVHLSPETYEAIGGLVSIALDRAQALEDVARNEAGRESERLRSLILDSITHELRTPLTAIKGAASSLLSIHDIPAEDQRELLTIVDEEADRLNRLVGQAVEMAQIEAGQVHMNLEPAEMTELVQQAQENCGWVGGAHPVEVTFPVLPKVLADHRLIEQVLCNLLENAAKYSQPGSPIFISAEEKNGFVLTSVADRGIGIDPSEQSLIFDRLYRSRLQNSGATGTGMGLAISRAILESHHGTLSVTSQPDHGSVFTFGLPTA